MKSYDVAVIGGGIVGLATAWQIGRRYPRLSVAVLEKESGPAAHQTGHNSGVLHSGIYYKPGSLKAVNCREGKKAMEAFCEEEGIPFERCGKVIVAVTEDELPAMERIYQRGVDNGIACEKISPDRLHELEPHAAGVAAIHVRETGIVDYREVCKRLAAKVAAREGGAVHYGWRVEAIRREYGGVILMGPDELRARFVVNCGGLHSDRLARASGVDPGAKIIPFKGEYYELTPDARGLVRNLIYPVPDPSFPFLGVHFTRMIDGSVECGPNAVLALGREAYGKLDFNLDDLAESLSYPGFLKLASRFWRTGAGEMWRSLSKGAFVRALQRLVPEIQARQLKAAPAGIRAQAVSDDGAVVDDFMIEDSGRVVNVGNAPSPAATASLNIGALITDRLAERF
ncbi:MAG: L-2-hydroxyglutarate oxidase [Verrucomicrobiota bacterium]